MTKQQNWQHLKEKIKLNPLTAIDEILRYLGGCEQDMGSSAGKNLLTLFKESVAETISPPIVSSISDPDLVLFDKNLSQDKKIFVGVCFLRFISIDRTSLSSSSIWHKVFSLFDDAFEENLYKGVSLTPKCQTYEKESKLNLLVPNLEGEFLQLINSFDELEVFSNFRQEFHKKLNSSVAKTILQPFLATELLGSRLIEVFKSLEDYIVESGIRKIQLFELAKEKVKAYSDSAKAHGTKYSIEYLSNLGEKLIVLLDKDFYKSPLSKPADLRVKKSEKKYPLFSENTQFQLSLSVQNSGLGQAFTVSLDVLDNENISPSRSNFYLGDIGTESINLEIPCEVSQPSTRACLLIKLNWRNFDQSEGKEELLVEIQNQISNIDWDNLATEEPYSLEPVKNEDELVGRTKILDQLIARLKSKNISSSYIYGQKRVGKTSIAETLKARLYKLSLNDYLTIYLESGDYVHPDPIRTIEALGKKLCEKIKQYDPRFQSLPVPEFNGALSTFSNFLDSVIRIVPDYKILFILDEFDELPIDIYKRGSIGNSFFLTIRAIGAKENFGFLLVGGEKMEFIISAQGDALNKFQSIRVDYFDSPLTDFQELVRKPVNKFDIEISDQAVHELYVQTGGNPFFAKQICSELFRLMVNNRDGHVTSKEIQEATQLTIKTLASNSFLHFWEDGIFETGNRAEIVSIARRKILLAFAEASRKQNELDFEQIVTQASKYDLSESSIKSELRDFERRQVIVERDGYYTFKVPLFGKWLRERGVNEIITTFTDLDSVLLHRKEEEDVYVRAEEIVRLVKTWDLYQGKRITEENVRAWLSQFADNISQRLMFRILQKLKFYSADNIRAKMKDAQGIVVRGLIRKYEEGKRKRSDVLVSYLEGNPGKSGSSYAKLYADENEIYYENVVDRANILKAISEKKDIQALVFIDDFIGTGNSACEYFKELMSEFGGNIPREGLKIFFIAISGFQSSKANIEKTLEELKLDVRIYICDPLDDAAKIFSDKSKVFSIISDVERAESIARKHGETLVKQQPLGYGNCQAAIVFSDSCPNNSLPILWSSSKDWLPLFRRL